MFEAMDHRDRAKLCLACPPLFLHVLKSALDAYDLFMLKIGQELALTGATVDHLFFRRYMYDMRSSYDGVCWLNLVAKEQGVHWRVRVFPEVEDDEAETIEVMSCWQSEAGFDDHLRWRIETSRWRDIETKYIDGEPDIKLLPVMFRFD